MQLRQKLSSAQVAKRANIGRSTLLNIENGKAGINIGYYLLVLQVLGLESDFLFFAKDDELGRKLPDVKNELVFKSPKKRAAKSNLKNKQQIFI